jgi:hypothetical protein
MTLLFAKKSGMPLWVKELAMFEQAYVDGVMAIHLRGEVDVIATYRDKYPVTVVYQGVVNGAVWTRPLSDWHRSMTSVQGMKVFPVLLFSDGFWCYPCDLDTHKASLQEEGIDPNDYQTILVKLPLGAASNHGGEEEAIGCYIREHHLKPVFSMSL